MTSSTLEVPVPDFAHEPLVVAAATDDAFAMGLGVTLFSALRNCAGSRHVDIYVMDGGISPANRSRLDRLVAAFDANLHWLRPPDDLRLRGVGLSSAVTIATYYRLLIPEQLPSHHKRLIFLDSDLVVLGDLGQLWEQDMAGSVILAVADHLIPSLKATFTNWQQLGLPPDEPYFNSGVLVIDLERWRGERIAEEVIDFARQNRASLTYAEQDALNAVLHGKWEKLDPQWNLFANLTEENSLRGLTGEAMIAQLKTRPNAPAVLHFVGRRKPWSGRMNHPIRHVFFHYLYLASWFADGDRRAFQRTFAIKRAKSLLLDLRRSFRSRWRRLLGGPGQDRAS